MVQIARVLKTSLMLLILSFAIQAANVITWVPSYFIPQSKTMLNTDFGAGYGMKTGVTHLALQFWGPVTAAGVSSTTGSVNYVANGGVKATDTDVAWFKSWGATNNAVLPTL